MELLDAGVGERPAEAELVDQVRRDHGPGQFLECLIGEHPKVPGDDSWRFGTPSLPSRITTIPHEKDTKTSNEGRKKQNRTGK